MCHYPHPTALISTLILSPLQCLCTPSCPPTPPTPKNPPKSEVLVLNCIFSTSILKIRFQSTYLKVTKFSLFSKCRFYNFPCLLLWCSVYSLTYSLTLAYFFASDSVSYGISNPKNPKCEISSIQKIFVPRYSSSKFVTPF